MKNITNFFYRKEKHSFHLVDNSQLPVMTAASTFMVACSVIFYLNSKLCPILKICDRFVMQSAVILLIGVLFSWFITVVIESGNGDHTAEVRKGLRLGMILFILSEVMLFFSFFWAFFHVSLSPAITLGCVWPPETMQTLDLWGLPLFNTLMLLYSGLFLTFAHRFTITTPNSSSTKYVWMCLFITVLLGVTFLFGQFVEYKYGITFSWSDNVFGSIFYMTTGFHGFHVVIGTLFLIFVLVRSVLTGMTGSTNKVLKSFMNYCSIYSMRKEQHLGFESAAWYWHFVDVVWIFLFMTIYWWNTIKTTTLCL